MTSTKHQTIPTDANGERDWRVLLAHRIHPRTPNEIRGFAQSSFEDSAVVSVVIETEWGFARVHRDGTIKVTSAP